MLISNIEPHPLELPPLPTASPPKGGDETLEEETKSDLVPPFGGKVVRSTKRGMLSGKGTMLEKHKTRRLLEKGQAKGWGETRQWMIAGMHRR